MSARTRCAPSCANRRALARPMPVLAPVITAAFPLRRTSVIRTHALACGSEPVDAELHFVSVGEVARRALAQSHAGGGAGGGDSAGRGGPVRAGLRGGRRRG